MKKTIKSKIIYSNLILVFISLVVLLLMIGTFSIKNTFTKRLSDSTDIQVAWISIEDNLYLSMNRWLIGKPYENINENIAKIDTKINEVYEGSKKSLLMTPTLKKEIKYMYDLWKHSKKDFLSPIVKSIDDFVINKAFLNIESESRLESMKFDEINYYKKLNLKELVYRNYEMIQDPEKSKYIVMGVRLFEAIDLVYSSSESYTKKVNNVLELSKRYSQQADNISMIVIIMLIIAELCIGLLLSINNGDRISKPILRAANKLIEFVGESLERRREVRTNDEISQLNDYVNLLLSYYVELSETAKKLSTGDTGLHIVPKSDRDVMGNAFLGIVSYLEELAAGANEFINGNYNYQIKERSEKDILAKTYNKLSSSVINLLEQTKEMTRLESEIQAAAKIQSSVLPRRDENLDGYEISHISIAATEVGGDNYDFRSTKNGNWISIGDVSGHGLEAGILALIAQSAFNYGAFMFEHEERENPQVDMYNYVNKTLVLLSTIRAGSCSFMTQNYLFEKNGTFYCAGAHEIGLLYKKKENRVIELKELAGSVPFMGIVNEVDALKSKYTFAMDPEDVLVLYSDGVIEAKNGAGEQFDVANLRKTLETLGEKPVETIRDTIIVKLREFCEAGDLKRYNGSFADDVTLLVLKRQ